MVTMKFNAGRKRRAQTRRARRSRENAGVRVIRRNGAAHLAPVWGQRARGCRRGIDRSPASTKRADRSVSWSDRTTRCDLARVWHLAATGRTEIRATTRAHMPRVGLARHRTGLRRRLVSNERQRQIDELRG